MVVLENRLFLNGVLYAVLGLVGRLLRLDVYKRQGLSNVGFSNVGKSDVGGCSLLVAASGSLGCGCSYMT